MYQKLFFVECSDLTVDDANFFSVNGRRPTPKTKLLIERKLPHFFSDKVKQKQLVEYTASSRTKIFNRPIIALGVENEKTH